MAKCFVVMGFGLKTDYRSGRKLDLDKSYLNLIKPAVQDAGLECVRADEIVHAGIIDVPMYEQLLTADVVVADVSTMNPNAFYELGVRHALRPRTTIIVAETELEFPFDVGRLVIRKYRHLGEDIGVSEAARFKQELSAAIRDIQAQPNDDSPVYTFLRLIPPRLLSGEAGTRSPAPGKSETLRTLLDAAQDARASGKWPAVRALLEQVREEMQKKSESGVATVDPYILQQLALATYKADASETGLRQAHAIMRELHPETSNDPETLGLWGAIHKRLWEATADRGALDEAITAHERGFYIRNDPYNGINCAFLFRARASISDGDDAIADRVCATRITVKVIPACERLLAERDLAPAERYWARATIAEAYLGLGEKEKYQAALAQAKSEAPENWMVASTLEQLAKLEASSSGQTAASA